MSNVFIAHSFSHPIRFPWVPLITLAFVLNNLIFTSVAGVSESWCQDLVLRIILELDSCLHLHTGVPT